MVETEFDYTKHLAVIKAPEKTKNTFKVVKQPGGFIFYEVEVDNGRVPQVLSGRYSSLEAGVDAVSKYIQNSPKSSGVKRQYFKDAREKKAKDVSKSESKGDQHLREGTDNGSGGVNVSG